MDTIEVSSRPEWVATPVWVAPGDTLTFSASGIWVDATIPCSANGYPAPLFYAAGIFPRIKDDGRFFRLMGRIVADGQQPQADDPAATFVIGTSLTRKFDSKGRLFVFANDREGFYWNNWGSVTLSVEKTGG